MADDTKPDIPDWVKTPPSLTLVSDSALKSANPDADTFDLARQIGPLFEILRHPHTETPFAAAIYGDWGTGKTSAMHWLEGRLKQSNAATRKRERPDGVRLLRTAWFFPWKYQEREDVWRGLVAEVILACLAGNDYSLESLRRDAEDIGRFLGRSVVNILSAVKVTGGVVEADAAALKEVGQDFADTVSPENAYLNEFDAVMRNWVGRSLGKNERLVVFIDDLDRCMPDVALQVLEALKLYLNIEQLAFVIGIDKLVVDQLVVERYRTMGVEKDKALDYLSKMFQVEIPLAPTETEVEGFFADIVAKNPTWRDLEHREDALKPVIINLAKRSPREVKRLINSALIHASGVRLSKLVGQEGVEPPSPAQGVQNFLVRRILATRYAMETLAGSRGGIGFFRAWSDAVAQDPEAATGLHLTNDEIELLARNVPDDAARSETTGVSRRAEVESDPSRLLDRVPPRFSEIIRNAAFNRYLHLLRDDDLGTLMRIPYPEDVAAFGISGRADAVRVVQEAIARALDRKDVDAVTQADYASVAEIELANSDIEDLTPLAGLTGLQVLDLRDSQVQDLTPLAGLAGLQGVYLSNTQVQDLTPLARLSRLKGLDLRGTQVQDLTPLAGLTGMQRLNFNATQVQDLTPLAGLTGLQRINLNGTQVHDLAPLAGLTRMQRLYLNGTRVQDLTPLAGLTGLEVLDLLGTDVQDLTPLVGLAGLEVLNLQGTEVQDLTPLAGLAGLQRLNFNGTEVQDLTPLAGLAALQRLLLQGTQVQDLTPLAGLTGLKFLDVTDCALSNDQLAALKQAIPDAEILSD